MKKTQTLREQFLARLRNKDIIAISSNGFQLKGNLTDFDNRNLSVSTNQYGRTGEVLIENFLAVIPNYNARFNLYYEIPSDSTTLRLKSLDRLLDTRITCLGINGFPIEGILMAYDEQDVIIATSKYGGLKHVLVTSFSTIIPKE